MTTISDGVRTTSADGTQSWMSGDGIVRQMNRDRKAAKAHVETAVRVVAQQQKKLVDSIDADIVALLKRVEAQAERITVLEAELAVLKRPRAVA